jgi:hypothetical protein
MSHFSSADESCKHENDEEGKDCEEGTCSAKEELFAAEKSR